MIPSLEEIGGRFNTDKNDHGYLRFYAAYLNEIDTRSILEIGIGSGESLRMWRDAFPDARVAGVDIDPACMYDDVECHLGDATVPATFSGPLRCPWDLIIDDGSHRPADQYKTFWHLWPAVTRHGWYVIEDCVCAFQPQFGGDDLGSLLGQLFLVLLRKAVRGEIDVHVYGELLMIHKLVV